MLKITIKIEDTETKNWIDFSAEYKNVEALTFDNWNDNIYCIANTVNDKEKQFGIEELKNDKKE